MRKYGYYFFISLAQNLVFRFDLILDMFILLLRLGIVLYIWQAVFTGTSEHQGYTLVDVASYTAISVFIVKITRSSFEDTRTEEVRQGTADLWFVKPIGYPAQVLLSSLGKTAAGLVSLVPLAGLSLLGIWLLGISTPPIPAFSTLALFGLLLSAGWLIEHCIGLWIVSGSFWLEGAAGLQHFKWFAITIVSGSMIPPALVPDQLRQIIEVFPFQYMYAVPINLVLGRYSWDVSDTLLLSGWLCFIISVTVLLWHKAQKHYAGAGG